jgi:MoaA/NifB/PqqE/SkfB family radical SAM enzyme
MANLAYIQITRKCNQKCRFCSNPPSRYKPFPINTLKKLVDNYIKKRYDGVIFSGGEPTLYPFLPEIISYCNSKNFPCRIITNGQKLSDFKYLSTLIEAGLNHIHLSIYSHKPEIQNFLTQNESSFENIKKALENLSKTKIKVDINITINKYNSNHLSELVKFLVKNYPFLSHFVFNNLDPTTDRVKKNPDTIPTFLDFELELIKALKFLEKNKKTFRVERVPLCYLPEFEYCSTETRKIVKNEIRPIYFLDKRGFCLQKSFFYQKSEKCKVCFLNSICAGVFGLGKYYSEKEIYPVFVSKEKIIEKILSEENQ